ncbi:MAG: alpha/beta fold hydrolase [Frankiaceae bacterium]
MEMVTSADGTPIAYELAGSGPPLVIVLGAFCDRRTAASLAKHLAQACTVITYDRRGRGDSGDSPPYAVDREIEDLAAVIDEAGGPAAVFGHSSGAILALEAAAHGVPISKVMAYEPPYIVDAGRPRPAGLAARTRALVDAGQRDEAMTLFLTEGVQVPAPVVEGMRTAPMWAGMRSIAHTLPYDLAICGDYVMPVDRLNRVDVPALVISGERSPAWMRDAADALAATLPSARRVTLDGQDHGAADDVLAPVLAGFVSA